MTDIAIVWFLRDLRVHDHPALTAAARGAGRVPRATRLMRPSSSSSSTSAISQAQPIVRSPSSAIQTIPNSDPSLRTRPIIVL